MIRPGNYMKALKRAQNTLETVGSENYVPPIEETSIEETSVASGPVIDEVFESLKTSRPNEKFRSIPNHPSCTGDCPPIYQVFQGGKWVQTW